MSTIHPIFNEFLTYRRSEGAATKTIEIYERILRRAQEWMSDRGTAPERLTPSDAATYLNVALTGGHGAWGPLSPVTRAQHLTVLRSAYEVAIDLEAFDGRNPIRKMFRVKQPPQARRPRVFTNQDLRLILGACHTRREYLLCVLFAFTGLRMQEVIRLRWEPFSDRGRHGEMVERSWVDFESRCLRVCGKGEKIREVPIHPILYPLLREEKERATSTWVIDNGRGNYVHRETLRRWVKAVLTRAGVAEPGERVACHAFRHAFNDNLRRTARGFDCERRLLMGHSLMKSEGTNAVYQHYSLGQLAEVVNRVYTDDPIIPA
jgi:integrase